MVSRVKSWQFRKEPDRFGTGWVLIDHKGRVRANVWGNGTWHTWDEQGTGGENSSCVNIRDAKDQVLAAVMRQGWIPFFELTYE